MKVLYSYDYIYNTYDNVWITYKKPSAEKATPLSALDTKKK